VIVVQDCFRRLALIVVVMLIAGATAAQEAPKPPQDHPKVVLVLSGGGARGFAHIGVLRVLEELHIAPDLIVSTSMGSIVGGMYASGWSPDEIEEVVKSVDWDGIFTDKVPRTDLSFRRKQDSRPVMIDGRLHFNGFKPTISSGVIQGQKLNLLLSALESMAVTSTDFDRLPIPFRAVAADIANGEAVVISSGNLAQAMRASMSVPGALPPVMLDGRELVDGGIAANLPVGIAKDLGAERIIAVDISSPLLSEDQELGSFIQIYQHLNSLLTASNRDRDVALLGPDDLLIRPDLGDISFISFDRAHDAAAIGEETARRDTDSLRRFAAGDQRWAEFSSRPRATPDEEMTIESVRIDNTSHVGDRLVRDALTLDVPEIFDTDTLIQSLLELYNTRYFGRIGFHIEEAEGGKELVVDTPPPSWGPGSLQFGVGFFDDFSGDDGYALTVRHQLLPVNRRGGEWETFFEIGTVGGIASEFYQPLDWKMRWFVAPSAEYLRGTQKIWFEGEAVAEYEFRTAEARLAAGRVLGKWGELRFGAFTSDVRGKPLIGNPEFESTSERRGGGTLSFRIDTEDSVVFPRSGADVNILYTVSSETLGAETEFERIWGSASYAQSFGEFTIVPFIEYGDNLKPAESFFDLFFIGGFGRLSGLGEKELFGERVMLARLLGYRRLLNLNIVGLKVLIYAGGSIEAGNAYFEDEPLTWDSLQYAWSLFIGADTFIGPAIIGYGHSEGGRDRVYFSIGHQF
jgi:NTE family protein